MPTAPLHNTIAGLPSKRDRGRGPHTGKRSDTSAILPLKNKRTDVLDHESQRPSQR